MSIIQKDGLDFNIIVAKEYVYPGILSLFTRKQASLQALTFKIDVETNRFLLDK